MKKLFTLFIVTLAIFSNSPAYAERGWGWRGGWVGPALVGGVIAYDLTYPYRYPYPYPYAYPYPVYEQPYPVYVQPNQAYVQPAPTQSAVPTWYYCKSAKGYYPYVPSCPEGWQPVAAQPPQATPH
jgi:hypothetical protein